MAIVYDQTTLGGAANDVSGTSLAFTTTAAVAAGALIILAVTCDGPQDVSSITATGVTFVQDLNGTSSLGGGSQTITLWSGVAPSGLASGSTITANYTATSAARSIGGFSVLGAGGVGAKSSATANQNIGTTAWSSASVTISAGSILVGVSFNGTGLFTSTPTSPSVENGDRGNGGFATTVASRIETAGGGFTVAGTWSTSGDSGTIAVEYLVASPATVPSARVWPLALGRFRGLLRPPFGLSLPGTFPIPGTVFTDSGSGTLTLTGSATESHSHSNSPSGTITLAGSFAQAFSHSGSASGQITLAGTRTESLVGTDSRAGTITLAGTFTQSLVGTDSRSGTIVLGGTATEDFHAGGTTFNDSGSGTITLSGTRTESLVASDSRTGTIALAGTSTESAAHTASRTGTVTLAGTSNEVWGHVDSGTGTITLAGTRTESQAHVSSATGQLTLFGTSQEDFHGFVPEETTGIRRLKRRRWPPN